MEVLFESSGDLLADRRYGFAIELAERGDRLGAIDLLIQAIERAPNFASAWFALGSLREQLGDRSGAATAYRHAQAVNPEDRHGAGLRLIRLGEVAPASMPTGYVRTLFDQYASRFDGALGHLGYRGPELLLDALTNWHAVRAKRLKLGTVLDLGCGTGLAGAAIRPVCDWLVGIDVSAAMIAQARQKGLYDRLIEADLLPFMAAERHSGAQYHLILAADLLPYVYDLKGTIAAVSPLLYAGALFGFTAETHAGDGVVLGDKLRYAHSEAHVREAVAASGLTMCSLLHAWARRENGEPVPGLVVIAART
jgi:predicted TPR repeat methyltransferase